MQKPCTPERLPAIRRQYYYLVEVPFVPAKAHVDGCGWQLLDRI
jgi:hypothetical protein